VVLVGEATGEVRWTVPACHGEHALQPLAMSPGGEFVASVGCGDAHWTLRDAADGAVRRVGATHDGTRACTCVEPRLQEGCPATAHTSSVSAIEFSPCGQTLATGDRSGVVILWDAQKGEATQSMHAVSNRVMSLSFSMDGAWLASANVDDNIRVFDTSTGALLGTFPQPHTEWVISVHFSPKNRGWLAIAGYDVVRVLDVESGEMIWRQSGHNFAVFNPTGTSIATSSASIFRDVQLLDASTGALRLTMTGHTSYVLAAAFSFDGSQLASGSNDGTCKVWDVSTGALMRTINIGNTVHIVVWRRDWVRDTQRAMAFAMGQHEGLGVGSQVFDLDEEVVRMILDST